MDGRRMAPGPLDPRFQAARAEKNVNSEPTRARNEPNYGLNPFIERNNPKAISPSASLASLASLASHVSFKSLWREAMPRHVVSHSVCRRTLLRAIPRAGSVPGQLQAGCRKPGLAGSGKSEAQAAGKPPDLKPKKYWERGFFTG